MQVIHLEHISKQYPMGTEIVYALRDVSITIDKNEYVAIMGPSGSGKSTMMNILGCLDTPTSGRYELDGQDVSEMVDNELAEIRNKKIGFIFQSFNLLARASILNNVELPLIYSGLNRTTRKERATQVLTDVKLDDRLTHKPNELSGGQRQRVAIARALVTNPAIILADEPTGNLDSKTGDEIMQLFSDLWKANNTIIVVTHSEEIARYAHRIIKIKDGLIESDTVNDNPVFV
ncbi:MAG: ABC transporter ATP-binding protein [Ignavibacteria bacterium]|jgi:putative ABC transport system ATP-binding protein|nr:ABC transporter ATP-binding protein [Ignavibacteria bacterium]